MLTKSLDKHEKQRQKEKNLSDKLKLVTYQLDQVTKERDQLKVNFEQLNKLSNEVFESQKFESVYNR